MQTDYVVLVDCAVTEPAERRRRLAITYHCFLQAAREFGERVPVARHDLYRLPLGTRLLRVGEGGERCTEP